MTAVLEKGRKNLCETVAVSVICDECREENREKQGITNLETSGGEWGI